MVRSFVFPAFVCFFRLKSTACASISARRLFGAAYLAPPIWRRLFSRLHFAIWRLHLGRLHFGTPPFRRRLSGAAKKAASISSRLHSGWRHSAAAICITLALTRNDEELNKLMSGVTIAQGGVLPNIQAVLLPKKSQGAGGKSDKE